MSTAITGIREARKDIDPEDYRVGRTLAALMYRTELTPEGYLNRRPITQEELARGAKVSPGLISQICTGRKHMSNQVLLRIAAYLDIQPIVIKVPDPEIQQQGLPFAA
jgi:hypothetical protein